MNRLIFAALATALALPAAAGGSGDHSHGPGESAEEMLEQMKEMHAGHDHRHDFEAMNDVSEEDMHRTMDLLMDIGLVLPPMDSARGRDAFLEKGCIVCHQVHGVGGQVGPSFDAADMPGPMNTFDFAARMWRGAPAMVTMQQDLFGEVIDLTGQELADIIAFVHDGEVQASLSEEAVPERFRALIAN
jgi:cytochrome c